MKIDKALPKSLLCLMVPLSPGMVIPFNNKWIITVVGTKNTIIRIIDEEFENATKAKREMFKIVDQINKEFW